MIENGVDFSNIPQEKIPTQIGKILMLGRIDPRKGQVFAIKAAEKLPDCTFSVVGSPVEGNESTMKYAEEIKAMVHEKNLANVSFSPEVSDPFSEILKHDLVLVLPTDPETFGRIVIESLALGKIVLSFDETGPREILQNFYQFLGQKNIYLEQNPFLVKSKDAVDLVRKISFFIKNQEKIGLFAGAAREFVQKNYNLSETKKRFLGLLTESSQRP